jgi:histidine triad (HIT) family protein
MPSTCIFCRIIAGKAPASIVYEDGLALAFLDLHQEEPPGHILVVPRRHVAQLYDLHDDEAAALMQAAVRLAGALRAAYHPDGLNLWQSNGAAAGQEIEHCHLHLMPRSYGDRLVRFQPRTPGPRPYSELEEIAGRIRGALASG